MPPVKKPKRKRRATFLREWRQYRNLTQEQAAGRIGCDRTTLSRIERTLSPYDQDFLEAAAMAYNAESWEILHVNPLKEGVVVDLTEMLRTASPAAQAEILGYARGVIRTDKAS